MSITATAMLSLAAMLLAMGLQFCSWGVTTKWTFVSCTWPSFVHNVIFFLLPITIPVARRFKTPMARRAEVFLSKFIACFVTLKR